MFLFYIILYKIEKSFYNIFLGKDTITPTGAQNNDVTYHSPVTNHHCQFGFDVAPFHTIIYESI